MMKYVLMVVFGLCVCSPVQAEVTDDEWQGFLTLHAKTYPILNVARAQPEFQDTARTFCKKKTV